MNITPTEVKRIAALSRLGLSDDEVESATENLSSILDHFSAIGHIDTKTVPSADDVTGLQNVTREDTAQPEALCAAADLLERAPAVHDQHIKVKSIF